MAERKADGMTGLINTVHRTILRHGMIQPGDNVVVAVSGGADSISLLHCLLRLRGELDCGVCAAHIHHGIRGKAADADAAFVEKFCRQTGVRLFDHEADVPKLAKAEKISLELAGRRVRYQFLKDIQFPHKRIATAHTKNDCAETVLLHLLRGCGTGGLTGIAPVVGDIIRPLLDATREEVEAYCEENGLPYRTDETNLDTVFTRNSVRHKLLPFLRQEYNPGIVSSLTQTAEIVSGDHQLLEEITQKNFNRLFCPAPFGAMTADRAAFADYPAAMQRRLLKRAYEEINGSAEGITFEAIETARALLLAGVTGKRAKLGGQQELDRLEKPGGQVLVENEYDRFSVFTQSEQPFSYALQWGESIFLPEAGMRAVAYEWQCDEKEKKQKDTLRYLFDYKYKNRGIVIRSRKIGDQFCLHGCTKKVKKLLIDSKIPRRLRERIPVIEIGGAVAAVAGFGVDETFRPQPDAKNYLVLDLNKGEQ